MAHNDLIQHPSVRACLRFLKIQDGVEIHHVADLPARSGLGTSSAFTVGLLLGLHTLKGEIRDPHTLAMEAKHVEQVLLGEAVGAQDQFSAAYGGFNRLNFHPDGSIEVKRLQDCENRLLELEEHLDLYFTGFSRTASDVAREQIAAIPRRKTELQVMFEFVNEAESILRSPHCPITQFGRLLHENWKVKRSLTSKISSASIDDIYEAGIDAGALGGKLLGAGGGGFMLFFVPPERRNAVRMRLKKLLRVPFCFSKNGSVVVLNEGVKPNQDSLLPHTDCALTIRELSE